MLGKRDVSKSQNALLGELGCSLLASVGVVCILRAHVRKPGWEEAAEDGAGSFLAIATVALFASGQIGDS